MTYGVIFAFLASLGANASNLIEKRAVERMAALSVRKGRHLLAQLFTSRLWIIGFLTGVAAVSLLVVSYSLIPIAVVQTIFGAGLGVLVIGARLVLGEHLAGRDYIGLTVIVIATIMVSITLVNEVTPGDAGTTLTVVVASLVTSCLALLIYLGLRHAPVNGGVAFGVVCGLLYGIASLQTKAAGVLIHRHGFTSAIPMILTSPYPYIFAVTSLLGVFIFQSGMQRSGVALVSTITNALTGAYTVAIGSAVFKESLPTSMAFQILRYAGFGLVLVGGGLLATHADQGLRGPTTSGQTPLDLETRSPAGLSLRPRRQGS